MTLRPGSLLLIIGFSTIVTFSQASQPIGFCELFDTSISKEGSVVRTEAYMTYSTVGRVDGGDPVLYSPSCNNEDFFAVAHFAKKLPKSIQRFFSALPNEKNFILKLSTTGRLSKSFLPVYGHLSWSRSRFEIDKIEEISDQTADPKMVGPDFKADAPLTAAARSLHAIDTTILPNLLQGSILNSHRSYFHKSFTLIDLKGKHFSLDQIESFSLANLSGGKIEERPSMTWVQLQRVELQGADYIATGRFSFGKNRSRNTLEYRNVYRLDDGSFVLVKTSLQRIPD